MRSDPLYSVLANSTNAAPGCLLKVEEHVNTSHFTLPPNVALSRFLFQTEDFNGTAILASGFVLWPYQPRQFTNSDSNKVPIVAWAHGTKGWWAECAPSHLRDLDYQFAALFQLALQGYAVVAPDYAGLGVNTDASGNHIAHQYICSPAAATDLVYAVEAARRAWPELSEQFVVMGHSQGGGAAWGAA